MKLVSLFILIFVATSSAFAGVPDTVICEVTTSVGTLDYLSREHRLIIDFKTANVTVIPPSQKKSSDSGCNIVLINEITGERTCVRSTARPWNLVNAKYITNGWPGNSVDRSTCTETTEHLQKGESYFSKDEETLFKYFSSCEPMYPFTQYPNTKYETAGTFKATIEYGLESNSGSLRYSAYNNGAVNFINCSPYSPISTELF